MTNYKFNKKFYLVIESDNFGEVYICKHDWVRKKFLSKNKFAFTPTEIARFKKIKDQFGDRIQTNLLIAKNIFNGVLHD